MSAEVFNKARPRVSRRQHARADAVSETLSNEAPTDDEDLQERLLAQLSLGAKACREVEEVLRTKPAPELETIIQLHRVLMLKLSADALAKPELFGLVTSLMRPLLEWARVQEQRKARELAEAKYRDEKSEREAQAENEKRGPGDALSPETLEKIEHELNLF